jgi:membrane protease YdiL (CAAX protease family)
MISRVLIAVFLGVLLSMGFVPTSFSLLRWAGYEAWGFPLLACFFHFTLPKSYRVWSATESFQSLTEKSILPLMIAALFGVIMRSHSGTASIDGNSFLWIVLLSPLGEEFLFRGWLFGLFKKLSPEPFTATLLTSLSFSLWHLQNYTLYSFSFLAFQLFYTFFCGVWLGYLREKSGNLKMSLVGHILINLLGLASFPIH